LTVARAARYPLALLDNVSQERRDRFFVPDGSSFVVAKEVRELCIFSPHSVIRDPPFSRIDLVSCRNLLIYFGIEVQNQVIPTFHYA
ncbi:CheR family methyltransferase, partial [Caballeronia sp. INML3]